MLNVSTMSLLWFSRERGRETVLGPHNGCPRRCLHLLEAIVPDGTPRRCDHFACCAIGSLDESAWPQGTFSSLIAMLLSPSRTSPVPHSLEAINTQDTYLHALRSRAAVLGYDSQSSDKDLKFSVFSPCARQAAPLSLSDLPNPTRASLHELAREPVPEVLIDADGNAADSSASQSALQSGGGGAERGDVEGEEMPGRLAVSAPASPTGTRIERTSQCKRVCVCVCVSE